MNNQTNTTNVTTPTDLEIVMTRTFQAPRALLFAVYTQSEHLKNWWGPTGWTLPVSEMDFRVGGSWLYCMQGSEGEQSCGKAVYHEIVAPERFVYTDYFADAEGNINESLPAGRVTTEFIEQGGSTTTVRSTIQYPSKADRDTVLQMGMSEGMNETLNRLEAYLAAQ